MLDVYGAAAQLRERPAAALLLSFPSVPRDGWRLTSRIGESIPRGDQRFAPHESQVMSILSSVLERIPALCVGINLVCLDHPAGLAPLWMVPPHSVDPSTLGRNIPIRHSPPSSIVTMFCYDCC